MGGQSRCGAPQFRGYTSTYRPGIRGTLLTIRGLKGASISDKKLTDVCCIIVCGKSIFLRMCVYPIPNQIHPTSQVPNTDYTENSFYRELFSYWESQQNCNCDVRPAPVIPGPDQRRPGSQYRSSIERLPPLRARGRGELVAGGWWLVLL